MENIEGIPEAVKNFFEVRKKIEERWRKKMGKAEDMPESVQDFLKQLDKIDERWQKKLKDKEGVPGAVKDFFNQLDVIGDRWRKKMEKKEKVPEVVQEFFEQFPGRPERAPGTTPVVPGAEIHGSAERPAPQAAPETLAPEAERRVRRLPVRVEEEDIFGERVGKKIDAYKRQSLEKYELSMKEKAGVAGQLGRMEKDVMEDFDLKWYVENRDKVEEANFKFNPSNMEHVKMVVARLGGHNEINRYRPESLTGEELPTYLEKLKQIEALEKDLYKEFVPPDSQALIFNLLQKRAERIKGKIKEAEGGAKKALKKEDKELFEVKKGLAKNTSKMFSGEEMKGFWGERFWERKWWFIDPREIGGKRAWERKMGELNMDLDTAIGFTEAKYAAVKDRVVTEFIVKDLKKDKKTGPQLEAIEGAFRGMGREYIPFIDAITHRRGLEELTGGWEEDRILLGDFLRVEEIVDFSSERLDAAKTALENRRMPYEKAVRQQKGFVDWFLSLIFESLALSAREAERR